jgi:transposase InsO family protein
LVASARSSAPAASFSISSSTAGCEGGRGRYGEIRERRQQLRHPAYQKPELLADKPNEVWSWDITKLMGPAKWSCYYRYVILDIFSRRVVGWCVADAESVGCVMGE